MGTGWRRAFCTSIKRDSDAPAAAATQRQRSPSPPTPAFSSPRLRCRTAPAADATAKSPRLPFSPSRLLLGLGLGLGLSLGHSKSRCGICALAVAAGHGTAVFTAECSHAFHFPCIAAHIRAAHARRSLCCPVCSALWRQAPLLSSSRGNEEQTQQALPLQKHQHSTHPTKSYGDDEPLLSSPTSCGGGAFDPIPEDADGEGCAMEREFQGFMVAAVDSPASSSCTPKSAGGVECGQHFSMGSCSRLAAGEVVVDMMPVAALLSTSKRHYSYVVAIRVRTPPPPLDPFRRAPVDLVTVLDVGGSMTPAKLHMLKRAMRLLISSMSPADRLAIVAFSSTAAKRLVHLRRMSPHGRRSARQIVDRLVVCRQGEGGSCVAEALKKATKVLEDRRERNPVATVVLLSDGPREDDDRDKPRRHEPPQSSAAATRFAHLEIPIRESGFSGDGDPPEDGFTKCVGGLLSVVAQDVNLHLRFSSGEISAVYSYNVGRPSSLGAAGVRLGDLYAEEERELLIELRIPHHHRTAGELVVSYSYRDPCTQETIHVSDQPLRLPPLHAAGSDAARSNRLRDLFVSARALSESRRLVELNDLATASHLLCSARSLLLQSDQSSLLAGVEAELSEVQWQRQHQPSSSQRRRVEPPAAASATAGGEVLTPMSAWRAAERLAKVAIMRKSMNRVSDLHGFENARF